MSKEPVRRRRIVPGLLAVASSDGQGLGEMVGTAGAPGSGAHEGWDPVEGRGTGGALRWMGVGEARSGGEGAVDARSCGGEPPVGGG